MINGKKSATSTPASQPYVFVPGGFNALDQTWLMFGVVRLLEQSTAKDDAVNVFVVINVMTNNQIDSVNPIRLTYTGEVTADVLGKAQSVTEYEGWLGDGYQWGFGPSVLQVTQGGLVVSVCGRSTLGSEFGISNYKEYEPWQFHR